MIIKKIPNISFFPTKREVEIGNEIYEINRYFSGDKSITQALEQYVLNKAKLENNKKEK